MKYARIINNYTIVEPTADDLLEDGAPKQPELWKELVEIPKPVEDVIHKYKATYHLMSEKFKGDYKIFMAWEGILVEPVGRVVKLNGSELLFPQINETVNGCITCNYNRLPNSRKLQDGWLLVEETEKPTDNKIYRETGVLIEDADFGTKIKIQYVEVSPIPEPAFDISKLLLGRAFRGIGQEEAFEAYIASSPTLKRDWERAITLKSDDPLVLSACDMFKQMLGMSQEQIETMLKSCRA